MRTLFAPILIPPPPPKQSRLCCMTSEEDLKFGEAEIHDRRRDEPPQKLPGIPTSTPPKLKIRALMSPQHLCHFWICIMCSESKVSLPQVYVQLLKRSKVCRYSMTSEPRLAAVEQF